MIQSAFPSFYDQKKGVFIKLAAKKILSDFFDAKSVSKMKIFSYAFSFSGRFLGYILKKTKDYWYDY